MNYGAPGTALSWAVNTIHTRMGAGLGEKDLVAAEEPLAAG